MSVVSMPRSTKTPLGLTFSTPLPSPAVSSEVENIFIQNSLEEVRKVEEKLRSDIERKKDHLRSIVGERYRDLIDSADLIAQLSLTSKQVLNDVVLLKKRLGDVSKSLSTDNSSDEKRHYEMSRNVCRRLLLVLPEEIYNSISRDQPVDSAILYLLASDICAHLQLTNESLTVTSTQAQVRLARCRNSLSGVFRKRLGELMMPAELTQLDARHTKSAQDPTRAVGWLVAFIAIDYLSPLQSYEGFLNCRMDALQSFANDTSPAAVSRVIHCYLSTALLTTKLFVENHDELFNQLEHHMKRLCPPQHSFEKESVEFTLPSSIHPQLSKIVQHLVQSCHLDANSVVLDPALVYEQLSEWLKSAGNFLAAQIPNMLAKMSNLQALQAVCEDISTVLGACCCQNHVPSVNEIWNGFLAESVVARFEQLVRAHLGTVRKELLDVVDSQTRDHLASLWSASKLSANTLANAAKQGAKLEIAYSNRHSSELFVISHFAGPKNAAGFQSAMVSMDSLLTICKEFILTGLPLDYRETGLMKLRQETSAFGNSLVEMCRTRFEEDKTSVSPLEKFLGISAFSFAATFFFNFIEDWLANCNFSVTGKPTFSAKSTLSDPVFWSNCRNQISNVSVDAFNSAMDSFLSTEITQNFAKALESSLNCSKSDQSYHEMAWFSIEIEEEGDGGQKMISKISLPQQPSLSVYSLLSSLCRFATQSPAFLFKTNNLNTAIFGSIVRAYTNLISLAKNSEITEDESSESPAPIAQDCAIQHLFDFQLITALLVGDYRRNQQYASICIDVIHALESFVDPFDLNTFQPHLVELVRKYVKSVQSVFGLILSLDIGSHRASLLPGSKMPDNKTGQPASQATDDHNILQLNQHQGRITALSIPFSQAQQYPV